MSRRGNPYDNARAESFMKTLKSEEVAMNRYHDLAQARASIGHFLGRFTTGDGCIRRWGTCRRWSLRPRWRRPSGVRKGGCGMGFLRHKEIYRSDEEARSGGWAAPGAHRFDEFPAGYSLAGCSPAEPASASPAGYSIGEKAGVGNLFPANGNLSLFTLSHDRGAAQTVTESPSPNRSHRIARIRALGCRGDLRCRRNGLRIS